MPGPDDIALFEFDITPTAVLDPAAVYRPRPDAASVAVLCFFHEVVDRVTAGSRRVMTIRSEDGPYPVCEVEHDAGRVLVVNPGVGAPKAVATLEALIAIGVRTVVAVGGAGVLVPGLDRGHPIIANRAVRDEGTSFHYLAPGRYATADPGMTRVLADTLHAHGVPADEALVWTTDGLFRETADMVARRRDEGCVLVEMEAAALMACAAFREVRLGQLLYAGDDLSADEWDHRDWDGDTSAREHLFWLAAEAALCAHRTLDTPRA